MNPPRPAGRPLVLALARPLVPLVAEAQTQTLEAAPAQPAQLELSAEDGAAIQQSLDRTVRRSRVQQRPAGLRTPTSELALPLPWYVELVGSATDAHGRYIPKATSGDRRASDGKKGSCSVSGFGCRNQYGRWYSIKYTNTPVTET
jgi:hypothetical protein